MDHSLHLPVGDWLGVFDRYRWRCCKIRIFRTPCACSASTGWCGIYGNRSIWSAATAKPGNCFAARSTSWGYGQWWSKSKRPGSANSIYTATRRYPGAGGRRPAAGNPETGGTDPPLLPGRHRPDQRRRRQSAIAICARLLAPALPALCRAETAETATNMASFGTRHIINPDKFGRYLALALNAPAAYHLLEWLTGVPGTLVVPHRDPPRGHWLLCGYGRFGKAMVSAFGAGRRAGDHHRPRPAPDDAQRHWVRGDGTGVPALLEAGVRNAVGIAACTCVTT